MRQFSSIFIVLSALWWECGQTDGAVDSAQCQEAGRATRAVWFVLYLLVQYPAGTEGRAVPEISQLESCTKQPEQENAVNKCHEPCNNVYVSGTLCHNGA